MGEIATNEDINMILKNYDSKKLNTKNVPLTKYEKTRILGERASQIENGSTILISNPKRFNNAYQIAEEEFRLKKIPFIIKRPYNNGYEYLKLSDLY
jgi:DNA-directed RNA polymerase subunit K/omega